ncbi:glycosyltransferase family 4 protein [Planctomycetota bacterium]
MHPLKITINAQLFYGGGSGGIEQFTICLTNALGKLNDGSEEYTIIGPYIGYELLEPYVGPNQKIIPGAKPHCHRWEQSKRLLGPLRRPAGKFVRAIKKRNMNSSSKLSEAINKTDGFFDSLDSDIIHFPYQKYYNCNVPTIYNPHDLQHLHYPEFFGQEEISWREKAYPHACHNARAIAVSSDWVKDDIIKQYKIDPEKIYVIYPGVPTELYKPINQTNIHKIRNKFNLPENFVLYPAQTWPHKNHIRLLEAIKLLHDKNNLNINLVCTGKKNDFWPVIEKRIRELNIGKHVQFTDFINDTEIRALYHLAQFVILPSLFEGGGFPVLEAFRENTPVTCSNTTSLGEYGKDAALLFNPKSVEDISRAIFQMTKEPELRTKLSQQGNNRIRMFDWEQVAKAYRALYRKTAGRKLSDEDKQLLNHKKEEVDESSYSK